MMRDFRTELRIYQMPDGEWAIRERSVSGLKINPPVLQVDVHPEAFYPDQGCRLYSRCLSCPLPRCKEERRG